MAGRDVVVVPLEAPGGNAEAGRERVQLVIRLIADQVCPQATGRASLAGPDRIVDIDHGLYATVQE
jgi:hypothetical protein